MKLFFLRNQINTYLPVTFNNNIVATCSHHKHLSVVLDSELDFNIHIERKNKKVQDNNRTYQKTFCLSPKENHTNYI